MEAFRRIIYQIIQILLIRSPNQASRHLTNNQGQVQTPILLKKDRKRQKTIEKVQESLREVTRNATREGTVRATENIKNIMFGIITQSEGALKTFVFQKEETKQSVIIEEEIDTHQSSVNIGHLLARHCSLRRHKVSIYDPNRNEFVSLAKIGVQAGFINHRYLQPAVILIRYRKRQSSHVDEDYASGLELDSGEKRDARSKERTIAEVIELVKQWRDLHLNAHKSGNSSKKMNLQEAAKVVGVSKKSLDDYYCQLRLAEANNFDFSSNFHEKMGILRGFVKDCEKDKPDIISRHHKHPKSLKVIDQFEMQTRSLTGDVGMQEDVLVGLPFDNCLQEKQESPVSNVFQKTLFNIENEFYKGFVFQLDDPMDPFLEMKKGCLKQPFPDDSESIMFM